MTDRSQKKETEAVGQLLHGEKKKEKTGSLSKTKLN
jgi:hypothetical protein